MTELLEHNPLAPVILLFMVLGFAAVVFVAACLFMAVVSWVHGAIRNDREGRTASRAMGLVAALVTAAVVVAAGLVWLVVSVL